MPERGVRVSLLLDAHLARAHPVFHPRAFNQFADAFPAVNLSDVTASRNPQ